MKVALAFSAASQLILVKACKTVRYSTRSRTGI